MKVRVVLLLMIAMLGLSLALHIRLKPALAQTPPDWLVAINAIRTAAGLPAVTENTASTTGATRHSLYIVRNNFGANGGVNPHIEDPNLPGSTTDGAQAGATGDIAFQIGGGQPPTFQDALAGWMTGAYHWEGFLDPGLTSVGYGVATFQDAFPNQPVPGFDPANIVFTSAETLVFTRTFATRTQPIIWPPNGGTMPFTANTGGETPNPLASCPGYALPTGPSLSLQLPATPNVTAATLTQTGVAAPLDSCWFTNATVQFTAADQALWANTGHAILGAANAVIIFPKLPLTPGTYCASVTNNGTPINWSFQVGAGGGAPPPPCGTNAQPAGAAGVPTPAIVPTAAATAAIQTTTPAAATAATATATPTPVTAALPTATSAPVTGALPTATSTPVTAPLPTATTGPVTGGTLPPAPTPATAGAPPTAALAAKFAAALDGCLGSSATQTGATISGTYATSVSSGEPVTGTLTGTINGNVLAGTLSEPPASGTFQVTVSADGASFALQWTLGRSSGNCSGGLPAA